MRISRQMLGDLNDRREPAEGAPVRGIGGSVLAFRRDRWEGNQVTSSGGEVRDGVSLTNLDQPLFEGAGATKRGLVDYLDAVADLILAELRDRPLSVIRVRPGQAPFMQKNVPKYTPPWVPTVSLWAESSRREVSYALCNDRRTLLSSDSTSAARSTVRSRYR
jgi:hypothetical protein